jgi:ligand-binding sensor domain-containing protein
MNSIHLNALFLVFVFLTSCGQSQTIAPEAYTKPEFKDTVTSFGPNAMVRNVKQAKNGDILIAAYNGVLRYDGKSFTNITSRIPSPSFWDVLEDRKGNLWFATRDSGYYYYDGKTFQHFTTQQGLARDYGAIHLYEDKAGHIWFGTVSGAYRYDPSASPTTGGKPLQSFTRNDGLPSDDINIIMEDKTGKLWFGTRGDLSVYDGKTFTVLKNKEGKTFRNVWGILEDQKGNIWFGDVTGLWRYDPSAAMESGSGIFTKVSQRGAYAIIQDKEGNIWTTGSNGSAGQFLQDSSGRAVWALTRYDAKTLYDENPVATEIKSGPPAYLGLLEARDGIIWFGAYNGVYRYDGKSVTDFKNKEGQK